MSLWDLQISLDSLQWRNIELMQAIRINTLAGISPWVKQAPDLYDIYPLVIDCNTDGTYRSDVKSGLDRAKERLLAFNERNKRNEQVSDSDGGVQDKEK